MSNLWANLLTNVKREKFLAATNVFVMTLTFLVLGFFITVVFLSQSALHYLENQAQVTVFFKDDFPEESILGMQALLQEDERILDVSYVSKDGALKIFMELNKDDPILLESVSANILPASLEIKAKKLNHLSTIAEELAQIDGVEEVKFFKDVIERFRFVSNVIYAIGIALVLIFLLISYSVVVATLRMTISTKGVELEIQKLVGASDSYIKNPLIFQGVVFGMTSALIAGLLLLVSSIGLSFLSIFQQGILLFWGIHISLVLFTVILSIFLIASGALLGFIGSHTTIKKYLNY